MRRCLILGLVCLIASGCGSPQLGGDRPPSIGQALATGNSRRLTLPPTQFERLHFLAEPGRVYIVTAQGPFTAPLSLSLYPLVKNTAGAYDPAPAGFMLQSFQRTGTLPLRAEIAIPTPWNPQNPVVIELKNIGTVVSEPTVELQSK